MESKQERTSRAVTAAAPSSAAPQTLTAQALELQRSVGNRQLARLLGFGKKKSSGPTNVKAVDKATIDWRILAERGMHTITEAIDSAKDYAVERVAGTPTGVDAAKSRVLQLITKAKTDLHTAVSATNGAVRMMSRQGKGLSDAAAQLDGVHATPDFFAYAFAANVHELAMIRTRLLHELSGTSTPGKAQISGHYGGVKERNTTYDDEMTDSTKTIVQLVLGFEGKIGPGKRYATLKEGMKAQFGWGDAEVQRHLGERANITRVKALSDSEREEAEVKLGPELKKRTAEGEKPFSTRGWFSKFKGADFGIWVMDATGRIYSGEHKIGLFHHSTFLRGGDVVSAGEWKVIGGKLQHITNKSGHYFPDREQLRNVLSELATQGVPLGSVNVTEFVNGKEVERTDKKADGILEELGGRLGGAPQPAPANASAVHVYDDEADYYNTDGGAPPAPTAHQASGPYATHLAAPLEPEDPYNNVEPAPPYARHLQAPLEPEDPYNNVEPAPAYATHLPSGPQQPDDAYNNVEPAPAYATHLSPGPQQAEDPYNNVGPGARNQRPRSWRFGRRF